MLRALLHRVPLPVLLIFLEMSAKLWNSGHHFVKTEVRSDPTLLKHHLGTNIQASPESKIDNLFSDVPLDFRVLNHCFHPVGQWSRKYPLKHP